MMKIAVASLFLLCLLIPGCGSDNDVPFNVIVVSVDTMNRSGLKVFDPDAPDMPNLERFAAESLRFDNALSTASWTLPAHASLLTGLYPDRHGATAPTLKLRGGLPSLAEPFQRAGAETVAFTDGGFVHFTFGLSAGFDRYDQWIRDPGKPMTDVPRRGSPERLPGTDLFDRAISFLLKRNEEAPPFLLFLQTYAVHDYAKIHPWAVKALPPRKFAEEAFYLDCQEGRKEGSPDDWRDMIDLYDAELRHLDEGFGRLMQVLKQQDLDKSTVMVFLSDHGEGFAPQIGRTHHGGRLNEDLIRVPLLIRGPGVIPGEEKGMISLVDLMPTLIDFAGLSVPAGLDGVSMADALRGKAPQAKERPLFAMEHFYRWGEKGRTKSAEILTRPISLAVIDDGFWYIRGEEKEELYDQVDDPEQRQNLAGKSTGPGDRMRGLAEGRLRYRFETEARAENEEVSQQLRSLGYIR